LKTSTIGVVGSLLVSGAVSATGISPVLDLDFSRSAMETLKKRGIDDACIVAASSPGTFTYCREGSNTLWQYQTLDLVQQAKLLNEGARPSTDHGQISVAQVDSAACEDEHGNAVAGPTTFATLLLSLASLFLLIGLRYTYLAIMRGRYQPVACSDPRLQRMINPVSTHPLTIKALGAFGVAAALALIYCCYLGF
jgi:hypothetical protein